MRQVNYTFGETLEISTTIRDDGNIQTQEIVSSGPDALVAIKIDKEAALTPKMLRELADRIEGVPDKGELERRLEIDELRRLKNVTFPGVVDSEPQPYEPYDTYSNEAPF